MLKWTICYVTIKSTHGKYLVAEDNGQVNANGNGIGTWEVWAVMFHENNVLSLRGAHQKYLGAEPWGEAHAKFEEAYSGNLVFFTLEDWGNGLFAFKAYTGKYLVAESNGALNANTNAVHSWETFQILPAPIGKLSC